MKTEALYRLVIGFLTAMLAGLTNNPFARGLLIFSTCLLISKATVLLYLKEK